MKSFIKKFEDIRLSDAPIVGSRNASLGEMIATLSFRGISVPDGFATTAFAFRTFLNYNKLQEPLLHIMQQLDRENLSDLKEIGAAARNLILNGTIPAMIREKIIASYNALSGPIAVAVAVRSSATTEDMPENSFAGQHESYLNILGEEALLNAIQRCFASLYTDRAIKYREHNGIDHSKVALSVGVQRMVRSDDARSGAEFTLEPAFSFKDALLLSGIWGLGENIV
jgi:pyruvate,water dikinase